MTDWPLIKTSQLIKDGVIEIGDGYRAKNSEMGTTGLPFIRAGDVNGKVNTAGCELLNTSSVARVGNKRSRAGDVVLTTKGTVGRVAYVDTSTSEFVYSPQLCFWRSLRPDRLLPRFLFYSLQSDHLKHQMGWSSGQTDMAPYISLTDQRTAFELRLPPQVVQQHIADVLGSLDDKIELNRRMNETLEAMVQAIFRDWFVDFGPTRRKLEGATDPLTIMGGLVQDSERAQALADLFPVALGDHGLPEGWDSKPLLDQANWVNGAAYKNMHFSDAPDALPVVKIAELKNGVTSSTKRTNTALGERYRICDGELLFSWSGNPDTSIDAFVWIGGDAWLNQHIFAVRENGTRSRAALYVLLKALMPQFAELARNKQTTGLGHVTKEDMKRLEIAVAPGPVEAAFEEVITPLFNLVVSKLFENRTLAATRDLLLPKLMSGEIRLSQAEDLLEAAQ